MSAIQLKSQEAELQNLISDLLISAKKQGADAAEVAASLETGLSTTVRLGEVESLEFNRDKALGLVIYKDGKKGAVSTSDLQKPALQAALEAAFRIAEYTEADPCSGLADKADMAEKILDLDLYHPWTMSAEDAIQTAKLCEAAALQLDKRIQNSEGASFSSHNRFRIYGNTLGFIGSYLSSRHSLACAVIAKEKDSMERDSDYTIARDRQDLESGSQIGKKASERALLRLNARKIKTCRAPIIFSAEVASGLISHFIAAISGGSLYRKSSFLLDHLGKQVFPSFMQIEEAPHLRKGLGSAPFDQEGVKTRKRNIVEEGVLKEYVLSSYSARKLGLKTTGNAGGVHNLLVSHSDMDLPELLKKMGKGLLVTELMGHGVNIVTGDYSRGAFGFWVEQGEIQYPVHEITIAGNLKDLFLNLVAIGNDIETRTSVLTGSIWLNEMTIAGS